MLDFLGSSTNEVTLQHAQLSSKSGVSIATPLTPSTEGLVLIPDIFGLRPLVDETITQIASLGISVIALEQFSHIFSDPSQATREEKLSRINEMEDSIQCADILAAGELLRTVHQCTRVCLIGFCIGGMYAFKCAGTGQFDRVVSCYGMITLPNDWKSDVQKEPLEFLCQDTCSPLLAIIGGKDYGYAHQDDVEQLKSVLKLQHNQENGSNVVIYPDAGHAFMHDPNRKEYRSKDAKSAWKQAFEFMGFNL